MEIVKTVTLEFGERAFKRLRHLKNRYGCSSFKSTLKRAVRVAEEVEELEELEEKLKSGEFGKKIVEL